MVQLTLITIFDMTILETGATKEYLNVIVTNAARAS